MSCTVLAHIIFARNNTNLPNKICVFQTAITSAYDALLESRSFSILSVPAGSANSNEVEKLSSADKEVEIPNGSFDQLVVQGDKIKQEIPPTVKDHSFSIEDIVDNKKNVVPPFQTHKSRQRANVAQGGLEIRRPPRMRSENARSLTSVGSRASVSSRYSEQSINERKKLQEQTYTPDPRLRLVRFQLMPK